MASSPGPDRPFMPEYETSYEPSFLDPEVNATFRLRPTWAFGLSESDFTGSPTRWRF